MPDRLLRGRRAEEAAAHLWPLVQVHAHMRTCAHAHMRTCAHAHMRTCAHAHSMHARCTRTLCVHMYACTCLHVYACTCIHMQATPQEQSGPLRFQLALACAVQGQLDVTEPLLEQVRARACARTCIVTHVHAHACACARTCICTHVYARAYARTCICTHAHVHMHTHAHASTRGARCYNWSLHSSRACCA